LIGPGEGEGGGLNGGLGEEGNCVGQRVSSVVAVSSEDKGGLIGSEHAMTNTPAKIIIARHQY
jgi:hypothetical protein